MEWHPYYKWIIVFLILGIVRYLQQNSSKKVDLSVNTDDDEPKSLTPVSDESFKVQVSVNKTIVDLIEEMDYKLISNHMDQNGNFKIEFVNYENKLFSFKRQPTYVKLIGNDNLKGLSYTTWSDRYEYGQNTHNDNIAKKFVAKLKGHLAKHHEKEL